MKVVLIVLLFACFLTHAYIITTNRELESSHKPETQSRHARSVNEAENGNEEAKSDEMMPSMENLKRRRRHSGASSDEEEPDPNLHHNLFMVLDARKNSSAIKSLIIDLGKNYKGAKAVIKELALPDNRVYELGNSGTEGVDEEEVATVKGKDEDHSGSDATTAVIKQGEGLSASNSTKEWDYDEQEETEPPPEEAVEAYPDVKNTKQKPCSMNHLMYVEKNEKAGCAGALNFAYEVCHSFFDCMKQPQTSYPQCEPIICSQFNDIKPESPCFRALFAC